MNGWDLAKALRLVHRSNPAVFEWDASPAVYSTSAAWERISSAMPAYFMQKAALHHYLSMARGNYRECLQGGTVRLKKYLYVLRPLLAAGWILKNGTPPPVLFARLVSAVAGAGVAAEIEKLLEIKASSPEKEFSKRIPLLNDYIEEAIPALWEKAGKTAPAPDMGYGELNRLFLEALYS